MDQYLQEVSDRALENPGLESEMDPRPDYGEEIYHGSGRPEGERRSSSATPASGGGTRLCAGGHGRLESYLEEREPDARETVRAVEEPGKRTIPAPGDTRNERATAGRSLKRPCRSSGGSTSFAQGRLQTICNEIWEISSEQFDRTFKTNVYTMFLIAGDKGRRGRPRTGMDPAHTDHLPPEQGLSGFGQDQPIDRLAQPVEVAPAYVFLTSRKASYVSGEVIRVAGGEPLTT